jgi:monoamine oxidase
MASYGCPVTVYPPGQFCDFNATQLLNTPLASSKDMSNRPLVFFAATDVSVEFNGYMEGAVRQGHRVALMVNRSLNEMAQAIDDEDETSTWVPAKGYGVRV